MIITVVHIFNGSHDKASATIGGQWYFLISYKLSASRLKWMAVECWPLLWNKSCHLSAILWQLKLLLHTRIESSTYGKTSTTMYSFNFSIQDIFIWTPVVHKQHQLPTGYQEDYLQSKTVVMVAMEILGEIIYPHTFSLCGGDNGSSALSSSAWTHLWQDLSRGSRALDSDVPSLESQIAGV